MFIYLFVFPVYACVDARHVSAGTVRGISFVFGIWEYSISNTDRDLANMDILGAKNMDPTDRQEKQNGNILENISKDFEFYISASCCI
jgi:hypothetical protein